MFFFSSRRRHTRYWRDWSSDVCSSDLGSVMVEKNKDYIAAARLIGLPAPVIMVRHVLPNVLGPVLVIATINLALAIIDRKSTRLNSSHANISYAVFCLKKKKTKKNTI